MTSLHRLGELYTAAQDVATGRTKIELVSLADTTTWHMDQAIRKLTAVLEDGDTTPLADLVSCARSLRWILLTEPFPVRHSITRAERTRDLTALVTRCAHTVAATLHGTLHELVSLAESARAEAVPPAGELLLQSLDEIGWADCVAVLASTRAAHGTQKWFEELGLSVPVASVRQHARLDVHDSAFYIGPPSLFGPAVTTAPRARNITYIFGSWVRDRSLPRTNIAAYAEGASTLRPRLYEVGDQPRPRSTPPQPEPTLYPEPVWRPAPSERAPRPDDVMARQVLLGGGLSIMLDTDGELIRTLNPDRPAGDRVELRPVADLARGTVLVLREGGTGSEALYERTVRLLGDRGDDVEATQRAWKAALQRRLYVYGRNEVVHALRRAGLKAAGQAAAWTARTVARPQRDEDFRLLLKWLGLPPGRYMDNAALLRRRRSRAMAEVREELESALADADMTALEREGCLRIAPGAAGFAGITATRVLAISPHQEPVHKHAVRIPREDRSARWLE